ncbi:hypothetical protein [Geobacillus subterraneus]|uniref:DUF4926 domain-containing protein n=1 Tax=Geobacillus subterraneus TaxID=129338 RepID=A0A679FXM0_9BACL|nr:hypothetical protein [Geobacillus subterraneus]BBW98867.1 hypothetical protein GsuE55_37000 [Geobacillus subterraneus]
MLNQKTVEVATGIKGTVVDVMPGDEYPIGILWEDEDGVFWYKQQDIGVKFILVQT